MLPVGQQAHVITGQQLHADAHRLVYMLAGAIAEIDDAWNRALASQQGGLQAYALTASTMHRKGCGMTHHARAVGLRNSAAASPLADIDRDLARMRERLEAAIESAIALLDRLDAPAEDREPDAVGEDGGDWEPWLAVPEGC